MNLDWPVEEGQSGREGWGEADERRGALNDRDHHHYITSAKVTDSVKTTGWYN